MILKNRNHLYLLKKSTYILMDKYENTTELYETVRYAVDKRQRIPLEF